MPVVFSEKGWLAGVGSRVTSSEPAPVISSAEMQAYYDAMDVKPDQTRIDLLETLIADLKTAGVWSKMDIIGLHAAHDAQAGLINMKDPSHVGTLISAPVFDVDRGYTGDGVDDAIYWAKAASELANFSQNSALLAVYMLTNTQKACRDIGWVGTSPSYNAIECRTMTDAAYARIGANTAATASTSTSFGLTGGIRRSSSQIVLKRNTTTLATHDVSNTVGEPSGSNLRTLHAVSDTAVNYSDRQCALTLVGGKLDDTEWNSVYSIFDTYLVAVGAVNHF